jgi:hypothetical protein
MTTQGQDTMKLKIQTENLIKEMPPQKKGKKKRDK